MSPNSSLFRSPSNRQLADTLAAYADDELFRSPVVLSLLRAIDPAEAVAVPVLLELLVGVEKILFNDTSTLPLAKFRTEAVRQSLTELIDAVRQHLAEVTQ